MNEPVDHTIASDRASPPSSGSSSPHVSAPYVFRDENNPPSRTTGKVYLVGAGPGDPGLLTLRGAELLEQADVVLYDGLVNPLILRHSRAAAIRSCRREGLGGRFLDQDEINSQLVELARQGLTVVRLKGGDPFVFGRGSEEAATLQAAGIPFEVVPGITAAVAASAYAGISVTHRDHASAVAFVTGHQIGPSGEGGLDYVALARFPGTLVFYMGLHRVEQITRRLIAGGKSPDTPAAVVCQGTWPDQRSVRAPLSELAEAVLSAGLHPPSLIIVGSCVTLADTIDWLPRARPLLGLRLGITRPVDQAVELVDDLTHLGAEPVFMPTVEIGPAPDQAAVDAALSQLTNPHGPYDWLVFTSTNGVRSLLGRMWELGGDSRSLAKTRIAVIGEGTANALRPFGLRADLVPDVFRAEGLVADLAPDVAGKRVLWARATRGREVIRDGLVAAGAAVDQVIVYSNRDVARWSDDVVNRLTSGRIDWICLSSPSIAEGVARLLPESARDGLGTKLKLASISPITTAAATRAGLPIAAEATRHDWSGIFAAIQSAHRGTRAD